MTEVFGFIGLLFIGAFWLAVILCGVGALGLIAYGIGAFPFIVYRRFFKESVKNP